jgi:hypothetical protein
MFEPFHAQTSSVRRVGDVDRWCGGGVGVAWVGWVVVGGGSDGRAEWPY